MTAKRRPRSAPDERELRWWKVGQTLALAWLPIRARLNVPAQSASCLFPAVTADHAQPHMNTNNLSNTLRQWVDNILLLTTGAPGPDGSPLSFDLSLIYPYAFRHRSHQTPPTRLAPSQCVR